MEGHVPAPVHVRKLWINPKALPAQPREDLEHLRGQVRDELARRDAEESLMGGSMSYSAVHNCTQRTFELRYYGGGRGWSIYRTNLPTDRSLQLVDGVAWCPFCGEKLPSFD